jgi:hypothetical protein
MAVYDLHSERERRRESRTGLRRDRSRRQEGAGDPFAKTGPTKSSARSTRCQ